MIAERIIAETLARCGELRLAPQHRQQRPTGYVGPCRCGDKAEDGMRSCRACREVWRIKYALRVWRRKGT